MESGMKSGKECQHAFHTGIDVAIIFIILEIWRSQTLSPP